MVKLFKQYKWSVILIIILTLVLALQLGYAYGSKQHKILNTPQDCVNEYFKGITGGNVPSDITESQLVNRSIRYKLSAMNYTINSISINKETAVVSISFTGLDISTIVSNVLADTSQDQSYSPSALMKKWTKALDSTPLVTRSVIVNLTVVDRKWTMSMEKADLSKLLVGDLSDNISKLDDLVLSEDK